MSQNWIQVSSVSELKDRADTHRGETKYEMGDFRFKKAGSDDDIVAPNDHCEFLVIYQGNHVETFSIDRMSEERIANKLEMIRNEKPTSVSDWLNR